MIPRPRRYDILILFSFIFLPDVVYTDSTFDCELQIDGTRFNLTSLGGERYINQTRETPPTVRIDSLRFNLCKDLTQLEGIAVHDQCPLGTRACLTEVNKKENETDRIIAVIPVAQSSNLDPVYKASLAPKYLSLLLYGAKYPLNSSGPQTFNLTISCDPKDISEPKIFSYDGSRLDIEWSAPAGCPYKEGDDNKDEEKPPKDDTEKEAVGSGIGWFFLVILLSFAAYLVLGAYYNYSNYGATGFDLIPHRDFWKEVPYMLSDVVSHLCSNVRPRRTSSRSGYISV